MVKLYLKMREKFKFPDKKDRQEVAIFHVQNGCNMDILCLIFKIQTPKYFLKAFKLK